MDGADFNRGWGGILTKAVDKHCVSVMIKFISLMSRERIVDNRGLGESLEAEGVTLKDLLARHHISEEEIDAIFGVSVSSLCAMDWNELGGHVSNLLDSRDSRVGKLLSDLYKYRKSGNKVKPESWQQLPVEILHGISFPRPSELEEGQIRMRMLVSAWSRLTGLRELGLQIPEVFSTVTGLTVFFEPLGELEETLRREAEGTRTVLKTNILPRDSASHCRRKRGLGQTLLSASDKITETSPNVYAATFVGGYLGFEKVTLDSAPDVIEVPLLERGSVQPGSPVWTYKGESCSWRPISNESLQSSIEQAAAAIAEHAIAAFIGPDLFCDGNKVGSVWKQ